MVRYRLLGSLEVAEDGRRADLGPPKLRALLAILLLHANEIVPVERLIDLLWPDRPPRSAAHAIQVYVSALRAALEPLDGPDLIAWQPPGYVLTIDPDALDAHLVERLTAEGAQLMAIGDLRRADAVLSQVRELWHGPPLADFVYEEFAQDDIRHLMDVWLTGTESLAEVRLGLGDDATVLTLVEAAIREDPLRERPRRLQLLSLYRMHRAADALRAYEDYRRCLADELGAEPSPELQRLHDAIVIHDPALDRDRGSPPAGAPASARNPYKGLRAFGQEDAADFFGREALVGLLLDALVGGARLVTLVGPSGSGKSSVLAAGLVPALRSGALRDSERWTIVRLRPGPHPLEALRLARTAVTADRDLLLVIDPLEEAFDLGAGGESDPFLTELAAAVVDNAAGVRAVVALRADFYDRPLLHPAFAAAFLPSVVNVVPMAAAELEAAIVEPARAVGVDVEPALLAELVSDTVDRPGALPLLQHVLAELFERRSGSVLTLEGYEELGGLRAALSSRAETAFTSLDPKRQVTARQVFLRLVRVGDAQHRTTRPIPVRALTELAIDPVVVSDVLRRFEADRLITFDRDPASDGPTVEIAHEALLTEWARLASWIEDARADLQRNETLMLRVNEWLANGRDPSDLLTGGRLDDMDAWARGTTLGLTLHERAYLDASLERRRVEEAELAAGAARERMLERRSRLRLGGLFAAAALLVMAVGFAIVAWPGRAPDVILVSPGQGDRGMYDAIEAGFNQAVGDLGLDAQIVIERDDRLRERLDRLADQGARIVVVAQRWSNPDVEIVARDEPNTQFIAFDYWGELPNVAAPKFTVEEGSYLAGAAAGLTSSTGIVGVIAEYDDAMGWPYVAGFEAGARRVDPKVNVRVTYLADRGDTTPTAVHRVAEGMFRAGADVIFYPGRTTPLGVFEAAWSESKAQHRLLWAISIDTDWYVALPFARRVTSTDTTAWRAHVLTSMVTRYDVGMASMLDAFAQGILTAGERRFGLADGAFELSTSGGHIDNLSTALEDLRARIVAGEIAVPHFPPDRGPPR